MGTPTEPIRDIMRRTMVNLAFIEQSARSDGPYEVTQLVNSFLGALAHPWEVMQDDLKSLPLAEATRRGWPALAKERSTDRDPTSLGDLVRLMRNGFAHGHIEFWPGAKGEIQALRIWNTDRNDRRTWGVIVTVDDARRLLLRFSELIEELHARQGSTASRAT
jgi:hypothetical protein